MAGLDVEGDDGALVGEPQGRGGQHEVRGGEVGGARGGRGEEILPRDGVEAPGAGDEAGDEPLGAGAAGGAGTAADRAAEAGLAGDDPVEDDGDEQTTGEEEAPAGRVDTQRSELEVGLLDVALEGGLKDAGLGSGVQAPRERRGLHGAEGLLVGAVAHRDGLGRTGGRGEETLEGEKLLRRDCADAGAEADERVGPSAAGGEGRVSGLGEIEEAGDEEPLRAVLLREGIEATRAQLERHARSRALDHAERNVGRVAVLGPGSGCGLVRSAFARCLAGLTGLCGAGERGGGDGAVRCGTARTVEVLEPIEVRRPVAQARVQVRVALSVR